MGERISHAVRGFVNSGSKSTAFMSLKLAEGFLALCHCGIPPVRNDNPLILTDGTPRMDDGM